MAVKVNLMRSWAKLEPLLDWYFEERTRPSISSLLSRLEATGSSAGIGDSPKMQQIAKIGRGLSWLTERERENVITCWVFRRQYQWWANMARNIANPKRRANLRIPSSVPENAAVHMSLMDLVKTREYFFAEYRRVRDRKVTRTAMSKLDGYRRNLWQRPMLGR